MNLKIFILYTVLFSTMHLAGFGQSTLALTGNWVGQTDLLNSPKFLQLRFNAAGNTLSGSLDVYSANAIRMNVYDIITHQSEISFKVETPRGQLDFIGSITKSGNITGTIAGFGKKGKMHLVKAYHHQNLNRFAGVYQNKSSKIYVSFNPMNLLDVVITENSENEAVLRTLSLIPSGEDIFFTSKSAIAAPEDEDEVVVFQKNDTDEIISIQLRQPSGESVEAKKIATSYTESQVVFNNNHIRLGGTLFHAKNAKKALIILQGAGPTLRTNWIPALRARYLAEMGITTLIFDKRGTGDTSGSSRQPTFTELAEDASAAVDYLIGRKDLSLEKIGISGMSESAWVVPIACGLNKNIRFAVIGAGGAITNETAHYFEIEQALKTNKFSAADIQEALAFTKLKWQYALTGKNWSAYKTKVDEVYTKKWFDLAEGPLDNDPKKWDAMRLKPYEDREAESYIRRMNIPLLLLFGNPDLDDRIPISESKEAWTNILSSLHYKDFLIKSYENTGHSIFYTLKDRKSVKNAAVYADLIDWLEKR